MTHFTNRLLPGLLLFATLITTQTMAQQNLFNIPSGDITPKNKVFYQHQFNLYSDKFESKGHSVYGLGRGWDAGVNVVSKGFGFRRGGLDWLQNERIENGALSPVVLATLQKQFVLSNRLNLNIGTQAGTNLSRNFNNSQFNHFTYGLFSYQVAPGRRILVGPYATNAALSGPGNQQGLMVGYEWKLTEKWYLMGDWISGRSDQGVGVVGAMFWPTERLQFCAGALLPNPNTPKAAGLVLEINILGWAARH
jgi:hypothetical protein